MSTAATGSHQAFISYSSRDRAWADAALEVLEGAGHRCWIAPRDITAGTEWGAGIIEGIDRCRIMVLIFSRHADASTQVRREVERAVTKGLSILPLRIEDVLPRGAMEYALSSTHWLDAFAPPPEARLRQLTDAVGALLSVPSPSAAASPEAATMRAAAVRWPRRPRWATWPAAVVGLIAAAVCVALPIRGCTGSPSLPVDAADVRPSLPIDPAAQPTKIVLNGTWTGSSETVFSMHATLVAEGTRVTGRITWRLIVVPDDRPDLMEKENTVGVEEVIGSLGDAELVIAGTSVSDPSWLGAGVYRVRLSREDGTFRISNDAGDAVAGYGTGTYVIVR